MFAPLIAAVLLAAPAGFTENPALDARAAVIAGKPAVHVYCAVDGNAWQTYVAGLPAPPPDGIANGYTPQIGGTEAYMSPDTCAPLLWKTRKHAADLLHLLGAALDILTHESMHMRGIADEGVAECDAIHAVPSVIPRWGYKRGTAGYRQVLAGARNYHQRLAPQYRTSC